MVYILIIFVHIGIYKSGQFTSITTQEFLTKSSCEKAKNELDKLVSGTKKNIEAICVQK